MEFPNPEDKRARTTRLFVGYALIVVLIGLATTILVYLAQGYGYDPNKGVSHNALGFFAAKPVSADIYIDNQQKGKTDTKLTLTEGQHQVVLKKDKYRDWAKSINVEGGSVIYLSYPRLFPVDITLGITQAYATPPVWVSQSLDRHWLLMQPKADTPTVLVYDLLKPTAEPVSMTIPLTQIANEKGAYGTIAPVEWADDNKHLILKQTLPSGKEAYIAFDREDVAQTQNITTKIKLTSPIKLVLRDKKFDKYYLQDPASGNIQTADLKNGVQPNAIITGVITFKSYTDNLILYTTLAGAKANDVSVMVLSNQTDTFKLQDLPIDAENHYLLDIAKYDNNWYYVTASASDKKVILYRDPLNKATPNNTKPIAPRLALLLDSPQFASFSDNARFIGMQSGKKFVIFDAELNRVYRYESPLTIAAKQQAKWMDGHRLSVVTDGKVQVFDFDGTNLQTLTASRQEFTPYFDRDYEYLYTLVPQADGHTGLQNGKLIVN